MQLPSRRRFEWRVVCSSDYCPAVAPPPERAVETELREDNVDTPSMSNRLLAEVVGTFGFFFIGFSGIASSVNFPGSIARAVGRKFPMAAVIPYWVAQLVGGFIAVVVANILYTSEIKDSLVAAPGKGVEDWRAMLVELVAVFLFVSVIITVATDDSAPWKGVLAPVAIGGFIFIAALTMSATSGGAFNPAVAIDPMVYAGELGNVWIYIVGPLIGGALAGLLSMAMRGDKA